MTALREAAYDPVHDAQRHFRVLLDAMAHPGQIRNLDCASIAPPTGLYASGAAIALALLNSDVCFGVFGHAAGVTEYLRQNTRSILAESSADADFLFVAAADDWLAQLSAAKVGDPAYPESGATLIIQVDALASHGLPGDALTLLLEGPGVKGSISFQVSGVSTAALAIVRDKCAEYPLGVETIFTCGERLVCIPRSSRIRWE